MNKLSNNHRLPDLFVDFDRLSRDIHHTYTHRYTYIYIYLYILNRREGPLYGSI